MASGNPFDILGDDDNDDPSHLIAIQQQKIAAKKPTAAPAAAKLPSKPVPPSQAVREAREAKAGSGPARGGGAGRGRGRNDRGGGGFGTNREFSPRDSGNENPSRFSGGAPAGGGARGLEDGERDRPQRQPYSSGRRGGYGGRGGGYGNGEAGGDSDHPPRRNYERRSGTGHGYEMKRDGAGRGNWGTTADDAAVAQEKVEIINAEDKAGAKEKLQEDELVPSSEVNKDSKDGATNEAEQKEEDKEMTLEEYEKIQEEKRKNLLALKAQERKVEIDEELQSMQQLTKKENVDVFVKLGADKNSGKKKENTDREEKSKKPVSINELLKPSEGERYYSPGGRGRGRGRGRNDQGSFRGGYSGGSNYTTAAPSIEDPGQFPTLGAK